MSAIEYEIRNPSELRNAEEAVRMADLENMPDRSMSRSIQLKSFGGRLVPSRQSGRDSVAIEKAASSTVRAIGPTQRPT